MLISLLFFGSHLKQPVQSKQFGNKRTQDVSKPVKHELSIAGTLLWPSILENLRALQHSGMEVPPALALPA